MSHSAPSPLAALARGAISGVIGTAMMTAWQTLAAKLQTSDGPKPTPAQAQDPWEQASAPAKVAKRIAEGVFHRDVSPDLIPLLTNVMHWGYGTGWATIYAISTAGRRPSTTRRGAAFGTAVWASSYLQLVPMGLYNAPWKYPPQELALDLSYHLVYGIGVARTFEAIQRGQLPSVSLRVGPTSEFAIRVSLLSA